MITTTSGQQLSTNQAKRRQNKQSQTARYKHDSILSKGHFSNQVGILGTNTLVSMSRFYPALDDTKACTRCNSACALYGQIDEETSWFGWCTLCNKTWHNRHIEGILLAVNWDFKRRSLAALTENNATALKYSPSCRPTLTVSNTAYSFDTI